MQAPVSAMVLLLLVSPINPFMIESGPNEEKAEIHGLVDEIIGYLRDGFLCPTVGCSSPPWEVLFPAP